MSDNESDAPVRFRPVGVLTNEQITALLEHHGLSLSAVEFATLPADLKQHFEAATPTVPPAPLTIEPTENPDVGE